MNRREQLFALVTETGISADEAARQIGIKPNKARTFYAELAEAGRVFRGKKCNQSTRFFSTAEAATAYQGTQETVMTEREATILGAVSDKGWSGYTLRHMLGMEATSVRRSLMRLAQAGKIHAGTNKRGITNYFKTKEAAQAFASTKPASALPPTVEVKATVQRFVSEAVVVKPAHVKVQTCPAFQGLGFADEPGPVVGGFRTMGVGRYLETA